MMTVPAASRSRVGLASTGPAGTNVQIGGARRDPANAISPRRRLTARIQNNVRRAGASPVCVAVEPFTIAVRRAAAQFMGVFNKDWRTAGRRLLLSRSMSCCVPG